MDHLGPESRGGSTSSLFLYVSDVDAAFARALQAGASTVKPVANQFWGDRMGTLVDPFGHQWSLATHTEDVPPFEIERRFAALMTQPA
jgi:PhnB protein